MAAAAAYIDDKALYGSLRRGSRLAAAETEVGPKNAAACGVGGAPRGGNPAAAPYRLASALGSVGGSPLMPGNPK